MCRLILRESGLFASITGSMSNCKSLKSSERDRQSFWIARLLRRLSRKRASSTEQTPLCAPERSSLPHCRACWVLHKVHSVSPGGRWHTTKVRVRARPHECVFLLLLQINSREMLPSGVFGFVLFTETVIDSTYIYIHRLQRSKTEVQCSTNYQFRSKIH